MTYQPQMPSPQIKTSAPTSALEQALGQKQKVEEVMRKYGKPINKQMTPTMQWEGDNNG